ncbi:hypothetical protein CCY99_09140 [Helicobacter sp. 16-1353]|uniref:hypothetical protein n=1 Tax=Helicobacter sp. 16-1353 TaxID=2004996 RepID=UPI000DCE4894|nr:hypothetical protein [Helicobacter sp. 16-1353]RAX51433.1 hypothetical protein CCY99_09140 [Helicobacter sp. 16-1353]
MKAIGGYFALELAHSKSYPHTKALHLQSARSALKLIIKNHHIKQLHMPYFTCKTLLDAVREANCQIKFYSISENFAPLLECKSSEWILYTNYFGINSLNVNNILLKYPNVIIDNAQSFFATPSKTCFYSPRKFLGVSDGGLLYDEFKAPFLGYLSTLEQDTSLDRAIFLFKRLEFGAKSGYKGFIDSEKSLDSTPPKTISNLTKAILESTNYTFIKNRRLKNYSTLSKILDNNRFHKDLESSEIPMIYPYFGNQKMRDFLINNKIFIAKYWANVEELCPKNSFEFYLATHLLPLPIDQRYDKSDMLRIAKYIYECLESAPFSKKATQNLKNPPLMGGGE